MQAAFFPSISAWWLKENKSVAVVVIFVIGGGVVVGVVVVIGCGVVVIGGVGVGVGGVGIVVVVGVVVGIVVVVGRWRLRWWFRMIFHTGVETPTMPIFQGWNDSPLKFTAWPLNPGSMNPNMIPDWRILSVRRWVWRCSVELVVLHGKELHGKDLHGKVLHGRHDNRLKITWMLKTINTIWNLRFQAGILNGHTC